MFFLSSTHLSDTGAGKTVAHILLNRVSQRNDSFVLDNSPSYPRWVDGSPRGPPRLSTIDVSFARNSVVSRLHQGLPEKAPSTPHPPLPAFLCSQQASNSSKKSDSELTTSLKLLNKSSDERLEFYGIDGKLEEESGKKLKTFCDVFKVCTFLHLIFEHFFTVVL